MNAFLEWVICDKVKHRKAASKRLRNCFKIANNECVAAIPTFSSTIANWIHKLFDYCELEVIEEIRHAKSRITISFDSWGSKHEKISVVGVVVHFINANYKAVTRFIGLSELPGHGKTGIEQASVILPLLTRFGITQDNLDYFVLDNATNNDTTLDELAKILDFKVEERRLRCIGHILNLIAKAYLFGQNAKSWEGDFKEAGAPARRQL